MTDLLREKAIQRALDWVAEYTTHLQLAIPTFPEGGPDENWMNRCQELDDWLRNIDTEVLRDAASTLDGQNRLSTLREAQVGFERAMHTRRNELLDLLDAASSRRHALRGYSGVGNFAEHGAFYVERTI